MFKHRDLDSTVYFGGGVSMTVQKPIPLYWQRQGNLGICPIVQASLHHG
jgi:hypothetical protein